MQSLAKKNIRLLRRNISVLPEEMQGQARRIAEMEERILDRFRSLLGRKISAKKTRVHGDYHLGQILFTGNDFFIIDFEGEPARSLSERRLKRCPMSDVAGLIRSLHYAAFTVSLKQTVKPEDRTFLEGWTDAWYRYMSGLFLGSYLARAREASFLPEQDEDLELLLQAFLLEKSVYELGYELNNRPHWIIIPLTGIKYLMDIR
jgi:maltose alpha-D-glucosyltransferase/alpha-amylase